MAKEAISKAITYFRKDGLTVLTFEDKHIHSGSKVSMGILEAAV